MTPTGRRIEQRLAQTISRIKGAGETHVMVTLADTGSREYLSEEEEREEYGDSGISSRRGQSTMSHQEAERSLYPSSSRR